MLWKESSIRELAAKEAATFAASDEGRAALRKHLAPLLRDPASIAVMRAVLVELLAEDEAKPMAERVTSEVRAAVGQLEARAERATAEFEDIIQKLEAQVDRALNAERAKIAEQKADMLEKAKEELRLAIIAQKSLATRQVNQHAEQQEAVVRELVARMDRRLSEAAAEAEERLSRRRATLLAELQVRLDQLLAEKMEKLALAAVKRQVREQPVVGPEFSNRELARLNGISIREVKRRRRLPGVRDAGHG
ncbi:hypothetical protein [Falsiroseomonas sp. HW251]|uniref:hypothetical protein n=1 Tax=Falsiroseomonas sp. HW251 TaxID=3390998 RepID=UPI003D321076